MIKCVSKTAYPDQYRKPVYPASCQRVFIFGKRISEVNKIIRKRLFAIILTIAMIMTQSAVAFADDSAEYTDQGNVETTEEIKTQAAAETPEPAEPAVQEPSPEPAPEAPAVTPEEPVPAEPEPVAIEEPAEVTEPETVPEEPAAEEPQAPEEPEQEEIIQEEPVQEDEAEEPASQETAAEEPVTEESSAVEEPEEAMVQEAVPEEAPVKSENKNTLSINEVKTQDKTAEAPKQATEFEFDNSTKLCDGTYTPDELTFTWTGGTGKARLDIDKLIVRNGKAYGVFTASSDSLTHVYLAHTESNEEDTSLYDPATESAAAGVYSITDRKVTIPVKVNTMTDIALRSTVMTVPHWIQYQYKIEVQEPEEFVFDNSTDIKDGLYQEGTFEYTFTGGTGKARFDLESVSVKNGKAMGTFTLTSAKMTHVYLANTANDSENTALYDPVKDRLGPGVYAVSDQRVTIPVKINTENVGFAARSTAMTDPHWINYNYTITIAQDAEADFDNSTTIKNGSYKPDAFSAQGKNYKGKISCTNVVIRKGKATAVFKTSDKAITHIYLGEAETVGENPMLYDPETDECGKNVYALKNGKVTIPVKLNEKTSISLRIVTPAEEQEGEEEAEAPEPYWTVYTYKITVKEKEEPVVDPTPGDSGKDDGKDKEDPKPEQPAAPTDKQKLKDGTYKVLSTTCRVMFYLYPKEQDPAYSILTIEDGKMTATITLTGEGYDYVYMGTPEQAKKAGKSKWIKAKIVNGYYTFTIPVSALDKKLPITPRSSKYANDGDPTTDPWRPDKWIMFYSGNAIKIKDGTKSTAEDAKEKPASGRQSDGKSDGKTEDKQEQTEFHNDNKKDKESKWQDDSSSSTSAVNSSTTLKDGVYTPDSFSWSGGSGRLAYIRCNKITVTNGQAYATIEFGSSQYDMLKANGRIYYRNGGGNSTFVIPVNLNANNVIIGRTTAMSSPHWVKYIIYIGKAESEADAAKAEEAKKEAAEAKMKISEEAPTITGLESKEEDKEKKTYSKYFKIFNYDHGVKLLSIDISKDTELLNEYTENAKKAMEISEDKDSLEYDDDGNIVAKSSNEYIEGLYKNNVINYLLVPEDYEVPAGLDKEYIIINVPAEKTFMASEEAIEFMEQLGCLDGISLVGIDEDEIRSEELKKAIEDEKAQLAGNLEKPEYAKVIKDKTDLALLPGSLLPEAIDKEAGDKEQLQKEAEEKQENLEKLESRFTALGVPVIVDRSAQEEDKLGQAEWIRVYGALYGCEEEAEKIFEKVVKEAEKNE